VEGLLVPMNDPCRLAQRVLALLADARLRERFSAAAREAALSWDQSVTLPRVTALLEAKTTDAYSASLP